MICKNLKYKILKGEKYNQWGTIKDFENNEAIALECNKCYHCKIKKMLKWKTRLMLEAKSTLKDNGHIYFITLTYNEQNLAKAYTDNGHNYEVSKMFKRIRKNNKELKLKYFSVNELGDTNGRIHHHIIIFSNIDFLEKKANGKKINNNYYYQNEKISWPNGFHSITKIEKEKLGEIEASINYVLKYLTKNPLGYSYSQKIGHNEMLKTGDQKKGIYIYNGNILKLPNYKNYLTINEIIKENKKALANKSKKIARDLINESKEIETWN